MSVSLFKSSWLQGTDRCRPGCRELSNSRCQPPGIPPTPPASSFSAVSLTPARKQRGVKLLPSHTSPWGPSVTPDPHPTSQPPYLPSNTSTTLGLSAPTNVPPGVSPFSIGLPKPSLGSLAALPTSFGNKPPFSSF